MDYEVDAVVGIDGFHFLTELLVPQVGVADESHAYGVAVAEAVLDARDVGDIEVGLSLVVAVVGVRLKRSLVAGREGKGEQAQRCQPCESHESDLSHLYVGFNLSANLRKSF